MEVRGNHRLEHGNGLAVDVVQDAGQYDQSKK
jgi:hypothetical protein